MNLYQVERALELFKVLNGQLKKKSPSLGYVSKELGEFISVLDELFKNDFYEPRITRLILVKKDIDRILDETMFQIQSFNPKFVKIIVDKVPSISNSLSVWYEDIFKVKILPFLEGNQYLKNLPVHKNPDRFYVMVKELNPVKIIVKNPLKDIQANVQAGFSNQKLLTFNKEDPISGTRVWTVGDRDNAPGSDLRIYSGHHRIYEIYKRYLVGKLDGDVLIEFVKVEKVIKPGFTH